MAKKWNARGDTATNMIVWFAAITAALILIVWFMRNNPYTLLQASDMMDEDLIKMRASIGNACNSDSYYGRYNPLSKGGMVIFSDRMLCINQTDTGKSIGRCLELPCKIGISREISLEGALYIIIEKNGTWDIRQG